VAILLDTGILYAYYDRRDRWHRVSRQLIESELGALLIPAPVLPEVDYLLGDRLGSEAQAAFYEGLIDTSFSIVELPPKCYGRVIELTQKYRDLRLGFVDAAVLALSEHLEVHRIATTDRRHFGAVRLPVALKLLPLETPSD
jgi:predicted nucleic acid-binding protein